LSVNEPVDAERHHQDHRAGESLRDEHVFDDPCANREEECRGPARDPW
jgi:hypothetical protein